MKKAKLLLVTLLLLTIACNIPQAEETIEVSMDESQIKALADTIHFQSPEWSPDDQQIAWRNNETGNWDIYLMNADGSEKQNLTASTHNDRNPIWSRDGQQILYQSKAIEQEGFDIYIMEKDGSQKKNLTNDSFDNQSAKWSPDGQKIIYTAKVNGYTQVMIMNDDGTGKRIISNP